MKCTCGHKFEPVVQWRHKLLCGDATDPIAVQRLMGGEMAGLCFTDPPYNVGKDYGEGTNDSRSYEEYKAWSRAWFEQAKTVAPAIVFTPGAVNLWMWAEIEKPKWLAIWVKSNQSSRNGAQGWNAYEPFLCYGKAKIDYDVWEYPVQLSADETPQAGHAVPKSLDAWQGILSKVIHDAKVVYDPFLGAGTTMVACENLGLQSRCIEVEPKFVSVCLERMVGIGLTPEVIQ